jgi:hypothetical protein
MNRYPDLQPISAQTSPNPAGTEHSMRSAVSSGGEGKSGECGCCACVRSSHGIPEVSNARWVVHFARFSFLHVFARGERMARSGVSEVLSRKRNLQPSPARHARRTQRTCSKEVAGLAKVLYTKTLTGHGSNELHAGENKVDCGALTRRAPVRAPFKILAPYVIEENMGSKRKKVGDLPLPYSVILLLLHIQEKEASCRFPLSPRVPHAVTCTAAGSYSSFGRSWLFYAVHIHYCGVMQ